MLANNFRDDYVNSKPLWLIHLSINLMLVGVNNSLVDRIMP